jgi:hypothetical protein
MNLLQGRNQMKIFLTFSLAGLILAAGQASAACIYIQNSYSGTVPANTEITVQGPFTITSANGCQQANISSTITGLGSGSPPQLFIDRLDGSNWTKVDGGNRQNVSALGRLGTYRVRLKNEHNVAKGYSGITRYGR